MDLSLLATFVAATATLAIIPGPNMALIVSTSVSHGTRAGLLVLLGTTTALVAQLLLVGAGLSTLLDSASWWFSMLRWLGALYLLYMGVQTWCANPPQVDAARPVARAPVQTVLRGLLVSATNPKTLLFFGAFFPQFLVPGQGLAGQLLVLSTVFVLVVVALDSLWAVLAGHMRGWMMRRGRLLNRVSGALLVAAGAGLALVRGR